MNTTDEQLINPRVPNVARVYDFLLGGKDNFAADRAAAEKILAAEPQAAVTARENRAFLGRAVRYLAEAHGIRQFLDLGSGLPAVGNVHEIAQQCAPESRVVYVDYDPVVLSHVRALPVTRRGGIGYAGCDLRDAGAVLAAAAETLDFGQPVAVLLSAILHFLPDEADPHGLVREYMDAVPAGSWLVVSHATGDAAGDGLADEMNEVYSQTVPGGVYLRSREEVERFFEGLELDHPGVTGIAEWHREREQPGGRVLFYGGAGRKPGPLTRRAGQRPGAGDRAEPAQAPVSHGRR